MGRRRQIILVAGARPNFMKIAPIHRALMRDRSFFDVRIVHTGQHYDYQLSKVFFDELNLAEPDVCLAIGSDTQGRQVARTIIAFEDYLLARTPDLVLVVGDVNSTIAAALTAAKLNIPVAHVEAGLRSFDRRMPEEINRIVTDSISEILYAPSMDAVENLRAEGVPDNKIHFVGNVMIDTLKGALPRIANTEIINHLGLTSGEYLLLTLHRPENVDSPRTIDLVAELIERITRNHTLVFPLHPRTAGHLSSLLSRDRWSRISANANLRLIDPVGYLDCLSLQKNARIVLTDSGGIQEETTALGVPCLTLRENTERPVTVELGTNQVVGLKPELIDELINRNDLLNTQHALPPRWDGRAADRIVEHLAGYFDFPNSDSAGRDLPKKKLMTAPTS